MKKLVMCFLGLICLVGLAFVAGKNVSVTKDDSLNRNFTLRDYGRPPLPPVIEITTE